MNKLVLLAYRKKDSRYNALYNGGAIVFLLLCCKIKFCLLVNIR